MLLSSENKNRYLHVKKHEAPLTCTHRAAHPHYQRLGEDKGGGKQKRFRHSSCPGSEGDTNSSEVAQKNISEQRHQVKQLLLKKKVIQEVAPSILQALTVNTIWPVNLIREKKPPKFEI